MSKLRDAAQQALEALEKEPADYADWVRTRKAARAALRAALAEQPAEQEPVAWRWKARLDDGRISNWMLTHSNPPPYAVALEPLYIAPQPAPDALREAAEKALTLIADAEAEASWHEYANKVDAARDALRTALEGK